MKILDNGKIIVDNKTELRKIIKECQIDLALIDIKKSKIINFSCLFKKINKVFGDFSKWDTSNVIFMNSCFEGSELKDIDISEWNIDSVKDLNWFFWKTKSINDRFTKVPNGHIELLPWLELNMINIDKSIDNYLDNYELELYLDDYDVNKNKDL